MAKPINFESFRKHALDLMRDGLKTCPCCGHAGLWFDTNEETDRAYSIRCRACGIGIQDRVFLRVYNAWQNRPRETENLYKTTHDIKCEYWDDEINNIRYVDAPKEQEGHST